MPYNGLSRLSKSRYQAGLQCPKRLWLDCYRRDLAGPAVEVTQAVFDTGHRVGKVAREHFGWATLRLKNTSRSGHLGSAQIL